MKLYEDPCFTALSPELSALFAGAGERSFFFQAAWYDLLSRHALPAGAHVRLYVEGGARPCAALVCHTDQLARGAHELKSFCNVYSCEHGPLIDSSEPAALAGLERLIVVLAGGEPWQTITIPGLDATDQAFRVLAEGLRRARFVVQPFFDSGTWYESTAGLSYERYLASRPSVLRNTWRRKGRQLESAGKVELRFIDGEGRELDAATAAYERVYRRSWKPVELFPGFIPALIALLARLGALRLGILYLEGDPIAAEFWIVWRGRAMIYKLAYDERFRRYSPGTYLTMRMMERVLTRDRPHEVNFGRGDDPYKKLWLARRRERWGIVAANPRMVRGVYVAGRILASRLLHRLRGEINPLTASVRLGQSAAGPASALGA